MICVAEARSSVSTLGGAKRRPIDDVNLPASFAKSLLDCFSEEDLKKMQVTMRLNSDRRQPWASLMSSSDLIGDHISVSCLIPALADKDRVPWDFISSSSSFPSGCWTYFG